MAVCGRCWLCSRKFNCQPGIACESCAANREDLEPPVPLGPPLGTGSLTEGGGWRICTSCVLLVAGPAGPAVQAILEVFRDATETGGTDE
jgi:hypothetical protein